MSTRILYKNAVVSEDELAEAYCRLSYNVKNKYAAGWTPSRFDAEYIEYVTNGRTIPDGSGEHRALGSHRNGKYSHFSYGVVEHGWV